MMPKFIQVWKQDFRLCWSFVSKQTLQRNLSKSRRTSALSMARQWKFVRITVAFWERKVILNEQWPFSGGVSFPSVFIAEIMPYGVISVFIWGQFFPTVPCSCLCVDFIDDCLGMSRLYWTRCARSSHLTPCRPSLAGHTYDGVSNKGLSKAWTGLLQITAQLEKL